MFYSFRLQVYKKYSGNTGQMITDISVKYPEFSFPQSVFISEVLRIHSLYSIPICLPLPSFERTYDPRLDIRNSEFDPELALSSRNILAPCLHPNMVDNLSKARFLLPGAAPQPQRSIKSDSSPQEKVPKLHILDKIAQASCKEKIVTDSGEVSLIDSPLALLDKFMKEKKRIRVLVRRRNRSQIDFLL